MSKRAPIISGCSLITRKFKTKENVDLSIKRYVDLTKEKVSTLINFLDSDEFNKRGRPAEEEEKENRFKNELKELWSLLSKEPWEKSFITGKQ